MRYQDIKRKDTEFKLPSIRTDDSLNEINTNFLISFLGENKNFLSSRSVNFRVLFKNFAGWKK